MRSFGSGEWQAADSRECLPLQPPERFLDGKRVSSAKAQSGITGDFEYLAPVWHKGLERVNPGIGARVHTAIVG